MKKVLSIILVIALVLGMSAITALADTAYNGDVAGIITSDEHGVITGTVHGDYNLTLDGDFTSEFVSQKATFSATVSGSINGEVVGTYCDGGLDTIYAVFTEIDGAAPSTTVRIVGVFLQSGTPGDFEGQIITGTPPAPVNSLTIGTTGGVTEMTVGQTLQMTAVTDPTGSYDINWSVYVNNRDRAWINEDGLLHALAPGSVTVIANTEDPNVATDTLTINVLPAETEVTAGVDPTYTIVIPASVDFGTLVKDGSTVTKAFDVKAQSVLIEADASIVVSAEGPFVMKDDDGAGTIPLEYTLSNSSAAIPAVGGTFTTFYGSRTEEGSVEVDTDNITAAGSYKGTMVFTISYND
jgi:hypothetical protein